MRETIGRLFKQFSSPRVWLEQVSWSVILAVIVRVFAWIFHVSLEPDREIAFWLVTPLVVMLGFSVLRSFRGYADLRGEVVQVSVGTGTTGKDVIATWLTVRNLGSLPSAATSWRIRVRVADSTVTSVIVPVQFSGAGISLTFDKGAAAMMLPNSEFMHNKGSHGIGGGSYIAGVLIGEVPAGIQPTDILRAGSTVTVTFQDINGVELRAEHVMTGLLGDQKWIPGINAAMGPTETPKKPKQLPAGGGQRARGRRSRRGKNKNK